MDAPLPAYLAAEYGQICVMARCLPPELNLDDQAAVDLSLCRQSFCLTDIGRLAPYAAIEARRRRALYRTMGAISATLVPVVAMAGECVAQAKPF